MKKRILFVDDEELVLRGLDRALRSLRDEWDMVFVDNGTKALEQMAAQPFDVVISDMRMPGMNGAQLLNEVMKRHPRTVRLILSGYADRDLILKCIGSTHQYLAKPCDARMLKTTVLRASRLEASLDSERLRQLIMRCAVLPSVPTLYSEIVEALQDPETDIESIGQIVVKDAAMTAKILKLVNSAFFGLGHEISSPSEAVAYLGTDTIKSLVLFANAFAQYEQTALAGFSPEALWAHSLEAGNAAKLLARFEEADRKLVDEAYVAGLLHDVGKLVLSSNLPEEYRQALTLAQKEQISLHQAEKQIFGADHATVGGYLLGLWGLPVPVVEAIAMHHQPALAHEGEFSPLVALHAGDVLVSGERPSVAGVPLPEFDLEFLAATGHKGRAEDWRRAWATREEMA